MASDPVEPGMPPVAWRRVLLATFLVWTAIGVLQAGVIHMRAGLDHAQRPIFEAFKSPVAEAWLWVVLAPPIIVLTRRVPITGPRWPIATLIHCVAAFLCHCIAQIVLAPFMFKAPFDLSRLLLNLPIFDLIRYGLIAAATQAFTFKEMAAHRERHALRLSAQLSEARLQLLTMQLQPHFLFNALHAISELAYRDPRRADYAITRLAELLRMAIASSGQVEGTLGEELTFLDAYVELERMRMGDRFTFEVDVAQELRGLAVPVLILQPLVENALRHAVRPMGGGVVRLSACRRDQNLILQVSDEGPGLPEGGVREGMGLSNTRVRLEGLYGGRQRLLLQAGAAGGTVVVVEVPSRVLGNTAGTGNGHRPETYDEAHGRDHRSHR